MLIQLNEIPSDGCTFDFNRKTGELNDSLKDIIGEEEYDVHVDVMPLGKSFDLRGLIRTRFHEVCSFCATEFDLPVTEKFHELVVREDQNHLKGFDEDFSIDEKINVVTTQNPNQFDVGELIHEVLALSEPTQPACRPGCKGLCQNCGQNLNEGPCGCAEQQKAEASPFSVLKKLKLN